MQIVTDSRWCSLKRELLRAYTHEQQEHPDLVHRKELSSRITYEKLNDSMKLSKANYYY